MPRLARVLLCDTESLVAFRAADFLGIYKVRHEQKKGSRHKDGSRRAYADSVAALSRSMVSVMDLRIKLFKDSCCASA